MHTVLTAVKMKEILKDIFMLHIIIKMSLFCLSVKPTVYCWSAFQNIHFEGNVCPYYYFFYFKSMQCHFGVESAYTLSKIAEDQTFISAVQLRPLQLTYSTLPWSLWSGYSQFQVHIFKNSWRGDQACVRIKVCALTIHFRSFDVDNWSPLSVKLRPYISAHSPWVHLVPCIQTWPQRIPK